jgi:hypothetical protein
MGSYLQFINPNDSQIQAIGQKISGLPINIQRAKEEQKTPVYSPTPTTFKRERERIVE